MATTQLAKNQSTKKQEEGEEYLSLEFKKVLASLPTERGWRTPHLYLYQGFWYQEKELQATISFQKHFQAQDTDIILTSIPRSGTIWLKSLAFAIANRSIFGVSNDHHPLLTDDPHALVPFFEYRVYGNNQIPDLSRLIKDPLSLQSLSVYPDVLKNSNLENPILGTEDPVHSARDPLSLNSPSICPYALRTCGNLENIESRDKVVQTGILETEDLVLSDVAHPRLFATHVPFSSLPKSIRTTDARIVYLCRNPLDIFISLWHLLVKLRPEALGPLLLEEAFEMYCKGFTAFGPCWDHMLGYWKESLERPEKVLFLKYEEMKKDITSHVRRLAEFLGCPFSLEEEREGVVQEIARLCSFRTMKESEGNRDPEKATVNVEMLRKGEVGDWVNHLAPSMAERLSKVIEEKLAGTGLAFTNHKQ